jgi:orotate phosphoribosyltransferase
MERLELAREINTISRLTGRFVLRSGNTSSKYFDKYQPASVPKLLREIAVHASLLIPRDTDVLAGLEMGGIPFVTALSLQSDIPQAFVRKEPKLYGTTRLAEGSDVKNKKVLVVEDVITTGGQVVDSVESLRDLGARIDSVFCVIDRREGRIGVIENANLEVISLFTSEEMSQFD